MWVLADIHTASLQSMPAHLSVEDKVQETGMSGKPTIFIHHEVLEVVANGDGTRRGGAMKSAAPVGKRVEKAPEMLPSVINSLMGLVPVGAHGTVVGAEEEWPCCRS